MRTVMPRLALKKYLWIAIVLASLNLPVFYIWVRVKTDATAPPAGHADQHADLQVVAKSPEVLSTRRSQNRNRFRENNEHEPAQVGLVQETKGSHSFDSFENAQHFMASHDLRNVTKIVLHYQNFTRKLPKFLTETDKETFLKSARNRGNLLPTKPEMLLGEVEVIRNGTFQMFYDCGSTSRASYFKKTRTPSPGKSFEILVPLIVPMGYIFQHFFDGTLPKISQAYEFLKQPNVKILLEEPYHSSIREMLRELKISEDKIVWHKRTDLETVYHAKYMITSCVTPPLHPILWRKGRKLLGIPDEIQIPYKEALVMYLTRAGATNAGRRALNSDQIENYLKSRYKDKLLIFKGRYSLFEAKHIFSRVKIIIGTHGGAFYNMNFAPRNTTIIEFVPTLHGGYDIPSLPHAIFWAMADLVGQPYWRVPCPSMNGQHDMQIDLGTLNSILDIVDPWSG